MGNYCLTNIVLMWANES